MCIVGTRNQKPKAFSKCSCRSSIYRSSKLHKFFCYNQKSFEAKTLELALFKMKWEKNFSRFIVLLFTGLFRRCTQSTTMGVPRILCCCEKSYSHTIAASHQNGNFWISNILLCVRSLFATRKNNGTKLYAILQSKVIYQLRANRKIIGLEVLQAEKIGSVPIIIVVKKNALNLQWIYWTCRCRYFLDTASTDECFNHSTTFQVEFTYDSVNTPAMYVKWNQYMSILQIHFF